MFLFTNNAAGPLRGVVPPDSSVVKLPAEKRILPSKPLMKGIRVPFFDQVYIYVRCVCPCVYGRRCVQELMKI